MEKALKLAPEMAMKLEPVLVQVSAKTTDLLSGLVWDKR
jgi:hypothetical protein